MRRPGTLLILVALLAGCAPPGTTPYSAGDGAAVGYSPTPSAPAPPSASPTPSASAATTCPASGVRLEPGEVDGAMGLRAMGIQLINCGTGTYRLNGYPVVRALDDHGAPQAVQVLTGVTEIAGALPGWSDPPAPVELKPHESATTVVVWRNTYTDISGAPSNTPELQMAPAAGRPVQVVTPSSPLDLGSTGRLGISPWRKDPVAAK